MANRNQPSEHNTYSSIRAGLRAITDHADRVKTVSHAPEPPVQLTWRAMPGPDRSQRRARVRDDSASVVAAVSPQSPPHGRRRDESTGRALLSYICRLCGNRSPCLPKSCASGSSPRTCPFGARDLEFRRAVPRVVRSARRCRSSFFTNGRRSLRMCRVFGACAVAERVTESSPIRVTSFAERMLSLASSRPFLRGPAECVQQVIVSRRRVRMSQVELWGDRTRNPSWLPLCYPSIPDQRQGIGFGLFC